MNPNTININELLNEIAPARPARPQPNQSFANKLGSFAAGAYGGYRGAKPTQNSGAYGMGNKLGGYAASAVKAYQGVKAGYDRAQGNGPTLRGGVLKAADAQKVLAAYNTHATYIEQSLVKMIELGERVAPYDPSGHLQMATVQLERSITGFDQTLKQVVAQASKQGSAQTNLRGPKKRSLFKAASNQ